MKIIKLIITTILLMYAVTGSATDSACESELSNIFSSYRQAVLSDGDIAQYFTYKYVAYELNAILGVSEPDAIQHNVAAVKKQLSPKKYLLDPESIYLSCSKNSGSAHVVTNKSFKLSSIVFMFQREGGLWRISKTEWNLGKR